MIEFIGSDMTLGGTTFLGRFNSEQKERDSKLIRRAEKGFILAGMGPLKVD